MPRTFVAWSARPSHQQYIRLFVYWLRRIVWDGGYMGNPPLFPLIDETDIRDLVILQINPFTRNEIPRTSYEIENRLNEITFQRQPDQGAARALFSSRDHSARRTGARDGVPGCADCTASPAEEDMRKLSVSSKLNAEWAFLQHLHDIGWRAADQLARTAFRRSRRAARRGNRDFVLYESLKPAHLPEGAKRPSAGNQGKEGPEE